MDVDRSKRLDIDNKHSVIVDPETGDLRLAKRMADGSFQLIGLEEPVILYRSRDKLALPMMEYYRSLCQLDGCTDYQMASMDDMLRKFKNFAANSSTMKQPGITKGT